MHRPLTVLFLVAITALKDLWRRYCCQGLALCLSCLIAGCASKLEPIPNAATPASDPPAAVVLAAPPLAMQGQGARAPTPAELEAEQQFTAQQIALAKQWIQSADPHQRIVGAEQLSAYEVPAAEALLLQTLLHTPDAALRQAAIASLAVYKNLAPATIDGLLKVLTHPEQSTQFVALNTLLQYGARVTLDAQKLQPLLQKMTQTLRTRHLAVAIKRGLTHFLEDNQPVQGGFYLPGQTPLR